MNPNSIYNPGDKFNRIRPFCILALLILLFLLLLFLAPSDSAGKSSVKKNSPRHETAGKGSGSGSGGGSGNAIGKGAGTSASQNAAKGRASDSAEKGAGSNAEKGNVENNPRPTSPQQSASGTVSSAGEGRTEKDKKEIPAPALPVKQWKSTGKPTRSEAEIWYYAKLHIRNIAKDKRDVFEFPEYGVPDTGMKKNSGNLYTVFGFFKLKTHDGKEKMYRFSLKIDLASYLCHDLEIKDL